MRRVQKSLLPPGTGMPLAVALAVHFIAFYGTKVINAGRPHAELKLAADSLVPFCPPFILIYVLAFVQWIGCYALLIRRSPGVFRRVAMASTLSEILAFACFVLVPTTIQRPEITGSGLWERLTGLIYAADTPVNLFPSLHCLQSWLCWRGFQLAPEVPKWYDRMCLVFTLLVCASTVLVKQHFLPDIAGGILGAELGLLLSRRVRWPDRASRTGS